MLSRLVFLILFSQSIGAIAQWSWVNPLPQGNTIHDVQFVNTSTGFAVGDGGTILKTIDGGYTWNRMENSCMESLNSV
ncbi:MAG: YCF48-related protein, partial [Bacteroidota bacterium]